MGLAIRAAIAALALAQPHAADIPIPPPLPGTQLVESTRVDEPLELKPATADSEAVIAGQSYVQQTYEPRQVNAAAFLAWYRDALFAAGWHVIDVSKIQEPPVQSATVHVSAHLRADGRNVYARAAQQPSGRYQVNVADVGAEDWAAQLARECRVRIHSIHFAHDRPVIEEPESEPTLRKLADLIRSKNTAAVRIEGHIDNIGEEGRAERETLSLGRARMVVAWLTTQGGVPANKVTAHGLGRARPVADNDTDLGRALNRRIEVARADCTL
jgi:outer membrane protein OmpA-like peptidoglycan-associated protein